MFEELSNVTDPTGRDLRLGKPHPCNLIHFDANPAPAFCAVRSAGSGRPRTFFLNEPKTPPNGFGGARPGVTRWTTISQMGCRYPAARRYQHQSKVEQTTWSSVFGQFGWRNFAPPV